MYINKLILDDDEVISLLHNKIIIINIVIHTVSS